MDDRSQPIVGPDVRQSAAHHFGGTALFDARRGRRPVSVAERMMSHPSGTLPQPFDFAQSL